MKKVDGLTYTAGLLDEGHLVNIAQMSSRDPGIAAAIRSGETP